MARAGVESMTSDPRSDTDTEPHRARIRNLRIAFAAVFLAGAALLAGTKGRMVSRIGFDHAPSLPAPNPVWTIDEQARYWAYALYDSGKFTAHFQMPGGFAVSRPQARRELERLLPNVSRAVLAEISAYGTVAFSAPKP